VALAALGLAAVGTGIYLLSKDATAKLDPSKTHTLEMLHKLLKELTLEYTCLYTRNYNMMLKMKENNMLPSDGLQQIEAQVAGEIADKTAQVLEAWNQRYSAKVGELTESLLTDWIRHFAKDELVQQMNQNVKKLHEDIFLRFKIEQIDFA
jgi:hypothetical protein